MKGVVLEVAVTLPEGNVERHRFFNDVNGPIHLATHGLVNEEEATRILGGPRRFRQFSLRFEAYLAHGPFRVRIDTSGKVKCYARED